MGNYQCEAIEDCPLKKSAAYGLYQCLVSKDREYAVVKKSIERAVISADQLKNEIEKRKKVKSINLVSLCSYTLIQTEDIIELKLQYEYVPLTLNQKRQIWRSLKKIPSQTEISNILLGVQNAILQLYNGGIGHRCINLDTILCLHSLYKLTDISMITFLTGYDLARQGDKDQLLSRHLLNYLHYQGTDPHYTIEDDLFSLAMVIITVVLDCSPNQLYSVDGTQFKKVNMKKIEKALKLIEERYSDWISKKLKVILQLGLKDPFETSKQPNNLAKTKGFLEHI